MKAKCAPRPAFLSVVLLQNLLVGKGLLKMRIAAPCPCSESRLRGCGQVSAFYSASRRLRCPLESTFPLCFPIQEEPSRDHLVKENQELATGRRLPRAPVTRRGKLKQFLRSFWHLVYGRLELSASGAASSRARLGDQRQTQSFSPRLSKGLETCSY